MKTNYLRIGAIDYALHHQTRDSRETLPAPDDDGAETDGMIDQASCSIHYYTDSDGQRQVVTLWHEVIHAILDNAGIDDHDEIAIEALSHGVVSVLRDNAGWIQECLTILDGTRLAAREK